jgi:hypothetical protein
MVAFDISEFPDKFHQRMSGGQVLMRNFLDKGVISSNHQREGYCSEYLKYRGHFLSFYTGARGAGQVIGIEFDSPKLLAVEQRVTFCRLASLLSLNPASMRELGMENSKISKYTRVLTKGKIEGYHDANLLERDNKRNMHIPESVSTSFGIRNPRQPEAVFEALWAFGMRPLMKVIDSQSNYSSAA